MSRRDLEGLSGCGPKSPPPADGLDCPACGFGITKEACQGRQQAAKHEDRPSLCDEACPHRKRRPGRPKRAPVVPTCEVCGKRVSEPGRRCHKCAAKRKHDKKATEAAPPPDVGMKFLANCEAIVKNFLEKPVYPEGPNKAIARCVSRIGSALLMLADELAERKK